MSKARSTRPANRPSRRHEILEAAVELLAVQPPDEIAVSDIASHCGMTPAAFYYHFTSKDEILEEIVAGFAERWCEEVSSALAEVHSADDLAYFVDRLLTWVEERERAARVYFVTSVGSTSSCETTRRRARSDLARKATRTYRELLPDADKIKASIGGLALVTLLEVVARNRLELDASYRTLGPVRFRASAGQLAEALLA